MLGFLSFSLYWVFFMFSFHHGSFCQVRLLLCLASASWGPRWGCFSQVKCKSASEMSGQCVISSVLSHCSKKLKRQDGPVLQLSLFGKQRKIHPWDEGRPIQKTWREERSLAQFWLLFLCFFLLPLSLPYLNWASQEGCLFIWGSYSSPRTFLCSIFVGFSLFCLLWIPFPILTT